MRSVHFEANGVETDVDTVVTGLDNSDVAIREAAWVSLGRVMPRDAGMAISKDAAEAAAAAAGAGASGLTDPEPCIRRAPCQALGRLAALWDSAKLNEDDACAPASFPGHIVAPVTACLFDTDESVRMAASVALAIAFLNRNRNPLS